MSNTIDGVATWRFMPIRSNNSVLYRMLQWRYSSYLLQNAASRSRPSSANTISALKKSLSRPSAFTIEIYTWHLLNIKIFDSKRSILDFNKLAFCTSNESEIFLTESSKTLFETFDSKVPRLRITKYLQLKIEEHTQSKNRKIRNTKWVGFQSIMATWPFCLFL